ncbi:MAG: radical SAM protein, partial [Armatimonadetes bacterium]|nr:radical SAM protein [Armatimonadota bacterium]
MGANESLPTAYRGVEVSELPVRAVLNRSAGRRVAMDLTINPYRGCEFGCRYCYARYTHRFLEHHDPAEFERWLYAKVTAPEKLAAELARMEIAGRSLAIGTATDPYQPIERQLRITRGILQALCGCRGATITLLTKSDLITRDTDLYLKLAERHELSLGFT